MKNRVDDQSRKTVDANIQIAVHYYHPVNSEESDHVNKVNEDVENKANDKVADLLIHDNLEENDASTRIEQELQVEVGVSVSVDLDQVHGGPIMVIVMPILILMNELMLEVSQIMCKQNQCSLIVQK